jgi:hypothetical protein
MNGIYKSPGFNPFNAPGGSIPPEETLDEDHESPRGESENASAIKSASVPRRSRVARRLREAGPPSEAVEEVEFDGNLAGLLDEVQRTLARFLVIPVRETYALTLWIAHTHAFCAAEVTPYIEIRSPEKRCGIDALARARLDGGQASHLGRHVRRRLVPPR